MTYTVKVGERIIKKNVDHIRSNHGNVLIEKNRQIDVDIELLNLQTIIYSDNSPV